MSEKEKQDYGVKEFEPETGRRPLEPLVVCKKVSVDGLDAVIGHYVGQGYEVKAVTAERYFTEEDMPTERHGRRSAMRLESVLVVFVKQDKLEIKNNYFEPTYRG